MSCTTTSAAGKWTAWFRAGSRGPWQLLGHADGEVLAWRMALAHHRGGDKTICRPGGNPNHQRPR